MIRTLSETPADGPLRTGVAVVGSGPAGTEIATFLAAQGFRVTVIESGTETHSQAAQSLNDADFVGRRQRSYQERVDFHEYLPPQHRGQNRLRQLGGTSCSWTGKWRVFERRDFEARSWIPHSGWPIDLSALTDSYTEIAREYGLGIGAGQTASGELQADAATFRSVGFKTVPFFQHAAPYRAADRLRAALSQNLDLLLDATVVCIELAEGSDRVASLVCKSLGGPERRIAANHVVLAAGGLESARLLLASNHQHPAGLGNGHDLVGRFFHDHVKINRARLLPGPLLAAHAVSIQTGPKPRSMLCLGLPDSEQERLGLLEASLFFRPVYAGRLRQVRDRLLGHTSVADEIGPVAWYSTKFAMEQAPNPQSRVMLGRDRDPLGVPRLVVDWRLSDLDRRSFAQSAERLTRLAKSAGLGTLDLGPQPIDIEVATDSAHHMGTTRMAATPRQGVVDSNCTVFGIPNLHVASSSVFPTGAAYSPTCTIVALARRLGRHLDEAMRRPVGEATAPRRRA